VNLAQRLQQFAAEGETVLSEPTWVALGADAPADAQFIPPTTVKGRSQQVAAWRVGAVALVGGTLETTGGEG
jgi:class 3 adenylate cyclase